MIYYTDRLVLKVIDNKEYYKVYDYYVRNREFLEPWEPKRNKEFYKPSYHKLITRLENKKIKNREALRLWIFKKEDVNLEKTIGTISFSNIIRGILHSCNMGYKLDKEELNKGYMTEAVKKSIHIMFNEMNLHRIEVNIMPRNKASLKVIQKLGFHYEGVAKDYLKINGVWEDHVQFALLNENHV